jgi:hypothetical protein
MARNWLTRLALLGSLGVALVATGCESVSAENVPVATTTRSAALDEKHGLTALLNGALGAGGGYLIGADPKMLGDNDRGRHRAQAVLASERAERNPATVDDARRARSADLNADGFVTLDEVIAMERAGLDDAEQVALLTRTHQVFELTAEQERYLEDRGIGRNVVREARSMDAGHEAQAASGELANTQPGGAVDGRNPDSFDPAPDRLRHTGAAYDRERSGD